MDTGISPRSQKAVLVESGAGKVEEYDDPSRPRRDGQGAMHHEFRHARRPSEPVLSQTRAFTSCIWFGIRSPSVRSLQ
jgi:hypothetical protein